MSALDAIMTRTWVIDPPCLDLLIAVASGGGDVEQAAEERRRYEALSTRPGEPLPGASPKSSLRNGVASIKVLGPIFHHANMLTEISGASSCTSIGRDFQAALDNPSVKAILLDVDSPGGQVGGTHELASMIRESRNRKPIHAYVSDRGASGAYWIASAADRVIASPTAALGSIGCIGLMPAADRKGYVKIRSAVSPRKQPSVETSEGRAQVQEEIDAIGQIFAEQVAQSRGVTLSKVLTDFGAGGLLIGQHAVSAGLADSLGSYESAHAALSGNSPGTARRTSSGYSSAAALTNAQVTEQARLETVAWSVREGLIPEPGNSPEAPGPGASVTEREAHATREWYRKHFG